MEALSLSYILLEIELRLLMTSNNVENSIPLSLDKIDNQRYLMQLANLAKDHGFLDNETWNKIKNLNELRKKAIHGLANGEITYAELEQPAKRTFEIAAAIQSRWITITYG